MALVLGKRVKKYHKKKDLKIFSKGVVNVITSKNHNQKLGIILEEMKFKNIIKMGSIGFKVCSLLRNEGEFIFQYLVRHLQKTGIWLHLMG